MKYLHYIATCYPGLHFTGLLPFLFLLVMLPASLAQPHTISEEDVELFHELISNPEQFSSNERMDIYYTYIGQFYSSNLDTAKILFQDMVDFGEDLQDEYVVACALSGLGEIYRMEGNYRQAIPTLLKALEFLDKYPNEKNQAHGTLSNVFMLVDQLDSAEIYADRSLELTLALKDSSGFTGAYLQKGIILAQQEKYYSALQNYFTALDYSDIATIPLRKVNTYVLIANSYRGVRDYENGMAYLKLALALAEEKNYTRAIAEVNETLGGLMLHLDSIEHAESCFLAALSYQGLSQHPKTQINIHSKLAELALRRDDLQMADQYLQTASSFLEANIDDQHKAPYYRALGKIALRKGFWDESIRAYQRVVEIGKEVGKEPIRMGGYAGLSKVYRQSGQYKKALHYRDSLSHLNQQLDLAFQNKIMVDLNQKYEANLKNEEIAKLNALQNVQALELNQKNNQLIFSIIGLFLAIAALTGFGYALYTKSRSHKALHQKNNQLREALENNKTLIKEIHHRVKNNLQMVSSLLNLQSRFETDGTVMRAINTSKNRVQSMSLLHQHLYLNEDLNSIKVKKYFEDLTSYLISGYPLQGKEVKLELDIEDIALDIDTVVPMGLICNELMTNALKYAYPDTDQCRLWVSIKEANGKIRLLVKDNGVGTTFTVLPEKSTSMGTQLIKAFANKLKASIEIDNFEGTEFKITFERKAPFVSINKLKNVAS